MAVAVSSSQNKAFKFDLDHLPSTHIQRGDRFLGIILILVGAFFSGILSVLLVAMLVLGAGKPKEDLFLAMLLGSVLGAVLFMAGLHQLLSVTAITIDERRISYSSKSLFSSKEWGEEFGKYEGILYRDEGHYGGKGASYTLYIVELYHTDKDKIVILYRSTSAKGVRAICEDSCRKLNLQAVEKDGKNIIARDVADLDKSVRDLVKDEKLNINFDLSQSPPKGLQAKAVGDMFQVVVNNNINSILLSVPALVIPGLLIVSGLANKNGLPWVIVGIICSLVPVKRLLWITRPSIRIGEDTVFVNGITPWGETVGTTIRTSEIESVVVSDDLSLPPGCCNEVLIKTDQQQVAIGRGLSAEALQWLKNCILSIIST